MTAITLDSKTSQALKQCGLGAELLDSTGNLLGFFVRKSTVNARDLDSAFNPDEIEAMDKQTTGRPLADILRDLKDRP